MAESPGATVAGRTADPSSVQRWLRLGLALVLAALGLDVLHREDWRFAVDFHTYFASALVGIHHGWSHLYDQAAIALEQKDLVPELWAQPYLSPPPVAWLAAPLTALPFWLAFTVWAVSMFAALSLAFAWASRGSGLRRWIGVVGALSPFWVMHAVRVGQVAPLVAAALVVAWLLLREKRDVAAGLVLVAIALKPNTGLLVPVVLLVSGRQRAFVAWLAGSAFVLVLVALTVGPYGMSAYANQLLGPSPATAELLTLQGALGATGPVAFVSRALIVGGVLLSAYRLRGSPNLIVPIAVLGSLLIAPYLHLADLCLLSAAGFMIWEERPSVAWRAPLAACWVLASPFLYEFGLALQLNRWPWLEFALLLALLVAGWWPLTAGAESRRRAPA